MTKDMRIYLAQMLEAIYRIERYTQSGRDEFMHNQMAQDAALRNLEIIGEAAKRVSEDYRKEYPDIPWRGMSAFRDVLIHDYDRVDLLQVWMVVEKDIPSLKASLLAILPPLDQLEAEIAEEDTPEK
jgi:uncharacterized protein with HEPN domain